MDAIETQVQRTSPILRITTNISELKSRESKDNTKLSNSSLDCDEDNFRHATNLLQKKKQLRPLLGSPNPYRSNAFYSLSPYAIDVNSKNHVSPFTQRVMSAKLLRVKQLQNELKETQIQLHDALNENRVLKTLQKRQDNALKKYEGDQAQLPQLIKSHNTDMRVMSTQHKQLKASYRELEQKLRQRDIEFTNLKEQHKHLSKLSADKHLGDRERLTKQVEDLQEIVKEQNDKIQLLTRRVELEGKNYKHQLSVEIARHKDTQTELTMAHETIETLKNLIEAKDKYISNSVPNRFYKGPNNNVQIINTGSLTNRYKLKPTDNILIIQDKEECSETPINAVTVEHPIAEETDGTSGLSSANIKDDESSKFTSSMVQNVSSDSSQNLRKKLVSRRLRNKSNKPTFSVQDTLESDDHNENDTETPHYSSSFPSVNNSDDSFKYTTSESDTITRMTSNIKGRRRISIDSADTVIPDDSTNNEDDGFLVDNVNLNNVTIDKNVTAKKNMLSNKRRTAGNSKDMLRRSSVSFVGSDDGPLENINEALTKAKKKDEERKSKVINKEVKVLEERLKKCSPENKKDENDSLENLLDKTTQSIKDELKQFEKRLLNSGDFSSSGDKSYGDMADDVVKKLTTGLDVLPTCLKKEKNVNADCDETLTDLCENSTFGDLQLSWQEMRDKVQQEKDETEALFNEYYQKITYNNSLEEEDEEEIKGDEMKLPEIKLGDDEKSKLLKALKEIDLEKSGRRISLTSNSDSDHRERRNSLNPPTKNVNANEDFNINSKPYSDYEFPVLRNVTSENDNTTEEFTHDFENNLIKTKEDLMEELFGKAKNISL